MYQSGSTQLQNAEFQRIKTKLDTKGVITQQEFELFTKMNQLQHRNDKSNQIIYQQNNIQQPISSTYIQKSPNIQFSSQRETNINQRLVSSIVENQNVYENQENYQRKVIEELKFQVKQREQDIEQLRKENILLQQKSLSLDVAKNDLVQKENNVVNLQTQCKVQEQQIQNLKNEVQRFQDQSNTYQKKLNDLLIQMPQNYRFDSQNDQVYSQREWNIIQENQNLQQQLGKLQKEKDKIYLENYELKKTNNIKFQNLDETDIELDDMNYQNNLQISELKIKQLEKKLNYQIEENTIIQQELNILRNLDSNNQNNITCKLKRKIQRTNLIIIVIKERQ